MQQITEMVAFLWLIIFGIVGKLYEIQSGGQMTLWGENVDNQIVDRDDIEKSYWAFFKMRKPDFSV